jgi:hypothetical protein
VDDERRVRAGSGRLTDMTVAPVPTDLLRLEVGLLRRRETRRVFDLAVYVGTLGGDRDSVVLARRDLPVVDPGLRVDVVSALLERTEHVHRTAWLVRPGVPELHDDDLAWLAAAGSAFAMHERPLDAFYALTRYGWLDVRTGTGRSWKRLRIRSS